MDAAVRYPSLAQARVAFETELVVKSPRTRNNYRSALNRLDEYLSEAGLAADSLTTDQLPPTLLEDFYVWYLDRYGRQKRNTASTYIAGMRAFLKFLDRHDWLPPYLSYEKMKDRVRDLIGRLPYRTPRTDDAIVRVVTYVNQMELPPPTSRQARLVAMRDRALIRTLYSTGMRRAELASLNRTDIQGGRSSEGLITGKGERERVVFFDAPSLEAIREYLEERADTCLPLFIRHNDGRGKPGPGGERWRLSPQRVWRIVKEYGRLAGVEVSTHELRHLKARTLLNNGAQLAEVQELLGHSSPETTKRIYAPYTKQHLRDAFERFSVSPEELERRLDRGGR